MKMHSSAAESADHEEWACEILSHETNSDSKYFSGLLHSKYEETMMPALKTSYMRTAEELRELIESTLQLLVDIEWMHLYIFLTTPSSATTKKCAWPLERIAG